MKHRAIGEPSVQNSPMTGRNTPLLNREVSRLDYNRRVLARAGDPGVPLLERLRFLTYCSSNLDEFFMVRVGAIRELLDAEVADRSPDGLTPAEQMRLVRSEVRRLYDDMYGCLNGALLPDLEAAGFVIESFQDLASAEQEVLREQFRRDVAPVLTPLAIDPGHPFPFLANLSLNVAAVIESPRSGEHVVLMKIPASLPRFLRVGGEMRFVPIGSLIAGNFGHFFPAMSLLHAVLFRVIRNAELSLDGDEVEDLRESVEAELRRRERKQVVCLEIDTRADDDLVRLLAQGTRTALDDVYRVPGFVEVNDLSEICDTATDPALHEPPFQPHLPQRIVVADDVFSVIREGDVLLHRPYDSFTPIVDLLDSAAVDPGVIAIKQTLYQTDEDSPIVDKLLLAALNGKQVSVVIELQTRFEERKNIALAARLQDAGAQVVYGIVGLQTHVKLSLVIRSEGESLRRYVHLSTGNYSAASARRYSDLDLLTCDERFGRDAAQLMNILTGYSAETVNALIADRDARPRWECLVVAPFDYQTWLVERVRRETEHARTGRPARITAKLNSLVDTALIDALYDASAAGVEIDLVVRAMCCLVPGLPGVSDRIRVRSIVDRFLEHSRIVRFDNAGEPEVYLSSGDWMPRNFARRVEVAFPLLDPAVRKRVEWILDSSLADTASAWELDATGAWKRPPGGGEASQRRFMLETGPSDEVGVAPDAKTVRKKRGRKKRQA